MSSPPIFGSEAETPIVVQLRSQRGKQGFVGLENRLPGGTLNQGDVVFTLEEDVEADVVVIQNYLQYDTVISAREGYIFKWDNEPIVRQPFARGLDRIFTHISSDDPRRHTAPPILDWWVARSHDELTAMELPAKSKPMSAIASTKTMIFGHHQRAEFVNLVASALPGIDVFGQGRDHPLEDKWDGLAPYRYSLAIENTSKDDYWTEKIADCFLSYTVPLYFGAKNIGEYFPPESFIWLPIDQPETALAVIRDVLENDDWKARLPALTSARELVLKRYSLGSQIMSIVRTERSRILSAPRTSRVVHGRRTRPGGWIRGVGIWANVKNQFSRRRARIKN